MNAIIHHASGVIMRRAIRDFGQKMVVEAKHEITAHLGPQDLDDMAPAILEKCSDQFLDRMLEHRLGTIDARSLINALARAERLGYTNSDVLDDRHERVVPTAQMNSPEVGYISSVTTSSQSQPPPTVPTQASLPFQSTQNAPPATDLKCRLCWRQFQHTKAYEYVSFRILSLPGWLKLIRDSMWQSNFAQKQHLITTPYSGAKTAAPDSQPRLVKTM